MNKIISYNNNKVSIIGIGKLGLPFALLLEKNGYNVLGNDIIEQYIRSLNDKSFYTNRDILKKMISNFINKKIDYKTNISKTKFVSKLIDRVKNAVQNSTN